MKKEITTHDFCEDCMMGKTKRVSFSVWKDDTYKTLKYVHANLWGSFNVHSSLSKKKYFLSIIDKCSRKVWLYFLKMKGEAFTNFCEWKTLIESQVNQKVKWLRTDNGLEFCNMEFDTFYKKNEFKAPYV